MLKVSDNFRGAALMVASMAAYVLNDTLVILLSGSLGILQVMFLRGLFATDMPTSRQVHQHQLDIINKELAA